MLRWGKILKKLIGWLKPCSHSYLPLTILPSLYDWLSFPFNTGVRALSLERRDICVFIHLHMVETLFSRDSSFDHFMASLALRQSFSNRRKSLGMSHWKWSGSDRSRNCKPKKYGQSISIQHSQVMEFKHNYSYFITFMIRRFRLNYHNN